MSKTINKENNFITESRSIHPYKPFVPKNATKLIIGSIPPFRFCHNNEKLNENDVRFYYGSNKNSFWPLLEEMTKTSFTYENTEAAIIERKQFLKDINIGITDIIESCIHKNNRSDDNSLKEKINRPLDELLIKYPKINTIICTSDFVRREINKFALRGNKCSFLNKKREGKIIINDKEYNVVVLYSPSRGALRGLGKNGKEKRKKQYMEVFNKKDKR